MAASGIAIGERFAGLAVSIRVRKTVVLGVALAAMAVGCSSEDSQPESLGSEVITTTSSSAPSTTSPSTTAPTTTQTTEATPVTAFPEPEDGEIFDEYIADRLQTFREIVRAAADNPTLTPEVDFPEIADYSDGPLLEANYEYLMEFAADGTALREPAESVVGTTMDEKTRVSPVIELNGDTLTIFECSVDDVDVVDSQTGEILISGVLTALGVVTMQRFDDGWKAVNSEITQTVTGVDGCFLAREAEFPY